MHWLKAELLSIDHGRLALYGLANIEGEETSTSKRVMVTGLGKVYGLMRAGRTVMRVQRSVGYG